MNSPQGDNKKELAEAQARFEDAQKSLVELQRRLVKQTDLLGNLSF